VEGTAPTAPYEQRSPVQRTTTTVP
jgi:hypothetical protein